jgi:SAM-dependent methyltransferase
MDFDRLPLKKGARVLDVGCGEGRHVRQTRRYRGVTSVGLDLGEHEVRKTAEALQFIEDNPQWEAGATEAGPWMVVRGSGYSLPFADESFDCVIISEVLEHMHDDDAAIEEIFRIMKPGGLLAVSVPRQGPETVCWFLSKDYPMKPGGHIRIYRRDKLREKIESHGYSVVGRHFAHGLHSPYWWIKCLVGVDNEDFWLVRTYHRLLVWDMMARPTLTRMLEAVLNPLIGKSVVFYAVKG